VDPAGEATGLGFGIGNSGFMISEEVCPLFYANK
jgi:hypothetical protein